MIVLERAAAFSNDVCIFVTWDDNEMYFLNKDSGLVGSQISDCKRIWVQLKSSLNFSFIRCELSLNLTVWPRGENNNTAYPYTGAWNVNQSVAEQRSFPPLRVMVWRTCSVQLFGDITGFCHRSDQAACSGRLLFAASLGLLSVCSFW